MKLWVVRHGQTDSNAAKRIQGQRIDNPLNETGRQQAQELAHSLADKEFDIIFSSPLKRARETAAIIAEVVGAPIEYRDELMELDLGDFSGRTWAEAAELVGSDVETLRALHKRQVSDYRPHGGESHEDFQKRFERFVEEIKRDYANKRVLVVAHAGIVRLAHRLFRETHVDQIANASIEEFEI